MTVLKEPMAVRPAASQHRHSSNHLAASLPKSRPHSHSMSGGSLHPAHRVTRRKSMSSNAVGNMAALAAAAKGMSGAPLEVGGTGSNGSSSSQARRTSKPSSHFRGPALGAAASMASSVPSNGALYGHGSGSGSYSAASATEAVTDGPPLAAMVEHDKADAKARVRRASEGSRLAKADGKRASGSDLRCDKCGKGYKHSSCLTKHLWEHTPEWQYTSKLLISKHQQVQLLEAASVLVAMNTEGGDSDRSSPSPPASRSSDPRDDPSSTDTTPPPQLDEHVVGSPRAHYGQRSSKRYSGNSSALSHSYQSTVFSDNGHAGHYRQWSNVSDRPTTSGTSIAGSYREDENDQADLAAAVGLLSCSYGTPKTGPMTLPPDVPPVPPLPAKFMEFGHAPYLSGSHTVTAQQSSLRASGRGSDDATKDVDMDSESYGEDEDFRRGHSRSRGRVDEDDEAFFGRMEE